MQRTRYKIMLRFYNEVMMRNTSITNQFKDRETLNL